MRKRKGGWPWQHLCQRLGRLCTPQHLLYMAKLCLQLGNLLGKPEPRAWSSVLHSLCSAQRGSQAPDLGDIQPRWTQQTPRAPLYSRVLTWKGKLISCVLGMSLQCRYCHCSVIQGSSSLGSTSRGALAAHSPSLPRELGSHSRAGLTHRSTDSPAALSWAVLTALPFLEGKNSN